MVQFVDLKLDCHRIVLTSNYLSGCLPPPNDTGLSILELQAAARRFGLNLSAGFVNVDGLPLDGPVIAHFDSLDSDIGHYVVLVPVGSLGKMVEIIDPPHAPLIVDYSSIMPNELPLKIVYPTSVWRLHAMPAAVLAPLLLVGALTVK